MGKMKDLLIEYMNEYGCSCEEAMERWTTNRETYNEIIRDRNVHRLDTGEAQTDKDA